MNANTNEKLWFKCTEKDYHGSYEATGYNFTKGTRCPYCWNNKIHPKDSFSEKYKSILNKIWDFNKNIEDPFNLAIKTHEKAWFKCEKHGWYERDIASASAYEFRCPTCSREHEEGRLQKR
ncbi:zinc-ribbon domain-containing protein [uncultured Clostridium sp.]|uniref:zinc-ribbon domain-containing protein n=1 Tax=uncultured Clostridium sp. TaxID=59620 RepID=UPI00338F7064